MRICEVGNYLRTQIKTCKDTGIQIAPVYITSKPGVGKSKLIEQIAEEFNCELYDARLAQFAPEDLRGVPYPNVQTKSTEWFTPSFFPRKNELAILFLDELDKAKPAVQNAALQLLLNRRLGEYYLPKQVFMVAAGNTLSDNSFSIPLSSALNNRMLHIELDIDAKDWIKWATEIIKIGKQEIDRIEEDVVGFIQFKPNMLHSYNEKERAWPSPRTWEFASNLLRNTNNKSKDVEIINLIAMAVGTGVSREFHAYRKIYKDINPKEILKGEFPDNLEKQDVSYKYAISTCMGFYVKNNGFKDAKEAKNCMKFLGKFSEEFRIISLRLMLQRNQLNNKINEWCKEEAKDVLWNVIDKVIDTD